MANHSYAHHVDRDVCRVCGLARTVRSAPVASESTQPASRARRSWRSPAGRTFENEPRCRTVQLLAGV